MNRVENNRMIDDAMSGESAVGARGRRYTLLSVAALTIMSGATIAPSLPGIEAAFADSGNSELLSRMILTVPALFIAMCAPFAGMVADRVGRRPLLIGAILLYALSGMSGLVLDSLFGLLVGRAFLGVAVAGTMTAATALAGDYFEGSARDRFMGLQAMVIGLSGLVFLSLGGVLADADWRYPFAIYGSALFILAAAIVYINEPPAAAHDDGTATARGEAEFSWLAVGALYAVAAFNSVVFYLIPTQMPFYLPLLGVEEASWAGLAVGLLNLAFAIASLAYGRLRGRLGLVGVFAAGFIVMAVGYGLVAVAETFIAICIGVAVTGMGMGAVMPNLMASSLTVAPPALRGRIAGGLTASIFIGQFISPLVSQPLIALSGYGATFRDMAVLLVLMAIAAAIVARRTAKAGP